MNISNIPIVLNCLDFKSASKFNVHGYFIKLKLVRGSYSAVERWWSVPIPVRPTFFLHMKHLFFFGLGSSGALSSLCEVLGWETDGLGWVTTVKASKRNIA